MSWTPARELDALRKMLQAPKAAASAPKAAASAPKGAASAPAAPMAPVPAAPAAPVSSLIKVPDGRIAVEDVVAAAVGNPAVGRRAVGAADAAGVRPSARPGSTKVKYQLGS